MSLLFYTKKILKIVVTKAISKHFFIESKTKMEVLDESSATTWRVVNVIKEVSAQLWVFVFTKSSYFNVAVFFDASLHY